MPTIQKFSDDGSTAGGPGAAAVDLNKSGRHHVVVLHFPKHIFTGFHVVMWHIEHVACQEETRYQTVNIWTVLPECLKLCKHTMGKFTVLI